MTNLATASLSELVAAVIADGVIDAQEVQDIRANLTADGVIDTDEVKALFEMNDAVTGNANDESWEPMFIELVTDNILADGTIDADEEALLIELIGNDGQVCGTEKALLENLAAKAELPAGLQALLAA